MDNREGGRMSITSRQPITANDIFKRRADTWLWKSLIAAAVIHFLAFSFGPRVSVADLASSADETSVISLPPDVPLPPAPPDLQRPPAPVITADGPPDATLPEMTFERYHPDVLPPPPPSSGEGELAGYETWTPRMVAPRLLNAAEIEQALERLYPEALKQAGIGGVVGVLLWVDEGGNVVQARLGTSSGLEAMDRAALRVVDRMRFSPALNRDQPVRVIVSIPLRFESH